MRSLCFSLVLVLPALVSFSFAGEYRDAEYGFALITPNLGAVPSGQQLQRVMLMGPRTDNVSPNVTVQIKQIQTTRESLIEQSDKDFVTNGMAVKAKNLREVNGMPAVSYVCEWTYQEIPLKMINLVVIEADRLVIVTCTAPAASFTTYEPEFLKTLNSFTLTQR